MLKFIDFNGQEIPLQGEDFLQDERLFLTELDKQYRQADFQEQDQVKAVQKNMNIITEILGLESVPEDGTPNKSTLAMIKYFDNNRELFLEYGIQNHYRAKELEKVMEKVDEPHEYAPTLDEMKALEIDMERLHD